MADAPVSIRDVAAHAGVSLGTVSNVLNRPGIVAEPTRSRVQAAIKQLGFIRNESARQLRAGRTAAQLLLDEALGEGSHQHRQVVFEPELVIRRSSQARPRRARRSREPAAGAAAPGATADSAGGRVTTSGATTGGVTTTPPPAATGIAG